MAGDICIPPLVVAMVQKGPIYRILETEVGYATLCENRLETLAFTVARKHVGESVHFIFTDIRNGQHSLWCRRNHHKDLGRSQ